MSLIDDQEMRDFQEYFACEVTEVATERAAFAPNKTFTVESLTALVETTPEVHFQNPADPHCGNTPDMVYLYTCHVDDEGHAYEVEMAYDLESNIFYFT